MLQKKQFILLQVINLQVVNMKKIILFLFLLCNSIGFSQQKTTAVVNLLSNTNASLVLNNTTSTATLTLSFPNDRWFSLQFGSFIDGQGMIAGSDVVYWNNNTLVDAVHNNVNVSPTDDSVNNWTLISNTDNFPSAGLRTIVCSRVLNTGDSNDYQFLYSNNSIDYAFAMRSTPGYLLNYHGSINRGYAIDVPFSALGIEDFSLRATQIYPNPSNGEFLIKAKTALRQVNVYSQSGAFVKTIIVEETDATKITIKGLQTGVYLLELVNDTEKSWKKVIVN
jgi:hypothetical protein